MRPFFLVLWLIALPTFASAALERETLAMGTTLSLQVEGGSRATEAMLAEVARIETACSTWRSDSVWSRLNGAQGAPHPMDPEWIRLLFKVQSWSHQTGGAFDPVMSSLIRVWRTREGGRIPSSQELIEARAASGSALLRLDMQASTARLLHPNAGLEEGGFLKGYALDAIRHIAQQHAVRTGLLNFGGQLLAWGGAVEVEVAHPSQRQKALLRIQLRNASLSTSGCSERGRHILDPRTGALCPDWGAVSVIADTGLEGDVLSTALFVLGPKCGPAWAESHRIAAVFLPHQGPIRMTTPFQTLNPTFLTQETP